MSEHVAGGAAGRGTVLVTGATGNTGSRIVPRLTALGYAVKAASRSAAEGRAGQQGQQGQQAGRRPVRFDWADPGTYDAALRGVDRLYLVPPVGDPDPAAVMLPFLARARAAGVRRAVLLSASALPPGGPGAGEVHEALGGIFDEWAVLRPSWFMQNFTGAHVHADTIRDAGVIMTAAGEGRVGFIDADDIAAVAVRALTDRTAPRTDLLLTGPEALGYGEVAAVIARITGRPVRHQPLTYERMRDRLAAHMPAEFAELLAGLDRAVAGGAEDRTTGTVEAVTGRPPRSFADYAAAHASAFGWGTRRSRPRQSGHG